MLPWHLGATFSHLKPTEISPAPPAPVFALSSFHFEKHKESRLAFGAARRPFALPASEGVKIQLSKSTKSACSSSSSSDSAGGRGQQRVHMWPSVRGMFDGFGCLDGGRKVILLVYLSFGFEQLISMRQFLFDPFGWESNSFGGSSHPNNGDCFAYVQKVSLNNAAKSYLASWVKSDLFG